MTESVHIPLNDYKVLVNCITFNQSKYIEDALNGMAMQQTNFPFVSCVLEDCSTDGEQDVIREWVDKNCDKESVEYIDIPTADVIIARHKVNVNCTFAIYLFKKNLWKKPDVKYAHIIPWREKCTYEALCEGDDYWTDPLKLHKQVDFMDANPDYVMCFHNAIEKWEGRDVEEKMFSNIQDREYGGVEMYRHWMVPTASVLFRPIVYKSVIYEKANASKEFIFGDIVLFLSLASIGKVRGLSDCMSVYRRTQTGAVMEMVKSYEQRYKYGEQNLGVFHVFGEEYKKDAEFLFHCNCINVCKDAKKNHRKDVVDKFRKRSLKYSITGHYKTFLELKLISILDYLRSNWGIDFYKLRRVVLKK